MVITCNEVDEKTISKSYNVNWEYVAKYPICKMQLWVTILIVNEKVHLGGELGNLIMHFSFGKN